jgi:2Fe-2S ferredoxin
MRIELAYLSSFSGRYGGKISGYFFRADIIGQVPKVTFLPAGETFEFEKDKLPYKGHGKPQSLLDVAMNFGLHLEHACGGSCACTTCHVVVKEGDDNLSEMEDDELDRVEQAAGYELHSRLGCQAVVKGDVTVTIPEWNRNYVSEGH